VCHDQQATQIHIARELEAQSSKHTGILATIPLNQVAARECDCAAQFVRVRVGGARERHTEMTKRSVLVVTLDGFTSLKELLTPSKSYA